MRIPPGLFALWGTLLAAGVGAGADPRPVAELPLREARDAKTPPRPAWLAFSPDGRWLATCYRSSDRRARVRVWSRSGWKASDWEFTFSATDGGDLIWTGDGEAVFSPKGDTLYFPAASGLYTLQLPAKAAPAATDLARLQWGRKNAWLGAGQPGAGLVDDGRTLVVATIAFGNDKVRVYRGPTAQPADLAEAFALKRPHVWSVAASRDGQAVAVGFDAEQERGRNHALEVWAVGAKEPRFRREQLRGMATVLSFSPDGKLLAVGGDDGMLTLWDATTGRVVRSWTEEYSIAGVDFHPTRPLVAYAVREGRGKPNLRVAGVDSEKVLAGLRPDPAGTSRVRFSPDGKLLAVVGSEDIVRVFETAGVLGE